MARGASGRPRAGSYPLACRGRGAGILSLMAKRPAPPRPRPEQNGQEPSEFDLFRRLTKKLVSVPKKEIEKQAAKKKAG
jgi:hypothetical protein